MITAGTKVAIMPGADYANRFTGQVGMVKKVNMLMIIFMTIPEN